MTTSSIKTLPIDRRYKAVKDIYDKAYSQMCQYFAARYSWGQACSNDRADDWAKACQAMLTMQIRKGDYHQDAIDFNTVFKFDSGNVGSLYSLIDCYHDGWELLIDLGIVCSYDGYDEYEDDVIPYDEMCY